MIVMITEVLLIENKASRSRKTSRLCIAVEVLLIENKASDLLFQNLNSSAATDSLRPNISASVRLQVTGANILDALLLL